jgi:hypothetical protein
MDLEEPMSEAMYLSDRRIHNRVTMMLEGEELELASFLASGLHFDAVLKGICQDSALSVRWKIDCVSQAPGTISARGDGADPDVEVAVRIYSEIAAAVSEGRQPQCGRMALRAVAQLVDIKDPAVRKIQFSCTGGSWSTPPHQIEAPIDENSPKKTASGSIRQAPEIDDFRGCVEGRFCLRDKVSGHTVRCNVDAKGEAWLRTHVDRPVILVGAVRRSSLTGVPLEISDIQQFGE